jgi:CDP-diacylglycerol--inositol 3-phosphatidyltransferase
MVHVLLYVPNLIGTSYSGYVRIILAVACLFVYKSHPAMLLWCYIPSAVLDAADGFAARLLKQESHFGMILDQVTDRVAYSILAVINAMLYKEASVVFVFLAVLDGYSHILMCSGTIFSGKTTHKVTSQDVNWLIRLYYSSKVMLFCLCVASEGFMVYFYIAASFDLPPVVQYIGYGLGGLFSVGNFLKQVVNFYQIGFANDMHATISFT